MGIRVRRERVICRLVVQIQAEWVRGEGKGEESALVPYLLPLPEPKVTDTQPEPIGNLYMRGHNLVFIVHANVQTPVGYEET